MLYFSKDDLRFLTVRATAARVLNMNTKVAFLILKSDVQEFLADLHRIAWTAAAVIAVALFLLVLA